MTKTEETEEVQTVYNIAVEPMPFTEVQTEDPDRLLRKWIIREVFHPDTPMNKATIQFMEDLFQWHQNGMQEPKIKAVK